VARATFNGQTIAESSSVILIEGNTYFPPDSLKREFFQASPTHTVCGWKGTASYYDVVVADRTASGAAWYYPDPNPAAANIKDYVAFWRGVTVEP
jgi:uncharacterized protein (DUF427 family)